jgi:hypothetical protein
MKQCVLKNRDGWMEVNWIADHAAVLGYQVNLKGREDEGFWEIVSIGGHLDDEVVKQNERQYKDHRKGTDI